MKRMIVRIIFRMICILIFLSEGLPPVYLFEPFLYRNQAEEIDEFNGYSSIRDMIEIQGHTVIRNPVTEIFSIDPHTCAWYGKETGDGCFLHAPVTAPCKQFRNSDMSAQVTLVFQPGDAEGLFQ